MQPYVLAHKLISDFNLGNQLVAWIVDFLSSRPQSVFVNGKFSDMRFTHRLAPGFLSLTPPIHLAH